MHRIREVKPFRGHICNNYRTKTETKDHHIHSSSCPLYPEQTLHDSRRVPAEQTMMGCLVRPPCKNKLRRNWVPETKGDQASRQPKVRCCPHTALAEMESYVLFLIPQQGQLTEFSLKLLKGFRSPRKGNKLSFPLGRKWGLLETARELGGGVSARPLPHTGLV